MARRIDIEYTKTYATDANAQKAVDNLMARIGGDTYRITYSINRVSVAGEERFGVLFYGERAVQAGIHFHFNVAG